MSDERRALEKMAMQARRQGLHGIAAAFDAVKDRAAPAAAEPAIAKTWCPHIGGLGPPFICQICADAAQQRPATTPTAEEVEQLKQYMTILAADSGHSVDSRKARAAIDLIERLAAAQREQVPRDDALKALRNLNNEIFASLSFGREALREAAGNTNLAVLELRMEEADALLNASQRGAEK